MSCLESHHYCGIVITLPYDGSFQAFIWRDIITVSLVTKLLDQPCQHIHEQIESIKLASSEYVLGCSHSTIQYNIHIFPAVTL